jgi:hypothetical protein
MKSFGTQVTQILWTAFQKLVALVFSRVGRNEIPVDESHSANATVLAYFRAHSEKPARSAWNYYSLPYVMQVYQEVDERLEEVAKGLPEYCYGTSYGYPVLVLPRTGVIFAFAFNMRAFVIRLPPHLREQALVSGAMEELRLGGQMGYPEENMSVQEFGHDWVFLFGWHDMAERWVHEAYDYAVQLAQG